MITWIIKHNEFKSFHQCKVGSEMVSEEVQKDDLTFYLKCFPNGSNHKYKGWVSLCLSLKKSSIPSNITNLIIKYYLYETQTSAVARGIARYGNHNDIMFNHNESSAKRKKREEIA